MAMKKYWSLCILLCWSVVLYSQPEALMSGPMVGHTAPGTTQLWVQTKSSVKVQIKYWESASPEIYFYTREYTTIASEGYTAHLIADKAEAGKKYSYELYINAVPVPRPYALRFSIPAQGANPGNFKLALGSCAYVNDSLYDNAEKFKGSGYDIYRTIYAKNPDAMLWLGDNVYFRKKDWSSKEGMMYRYTHTRSLPSMQPLLGSVEQYAIWDDHDFGPNDSDGSFKNKQASLEVFKLFWANPSYGFKNVSSATTTFVKEDVQFFLLDDRTFRRSGEDADDKLGILGEAQMEWLLQELKTSKARFKVVALGSQVLNPLTVFENYANYEEWKLFMRALEDQKLSGVVFLSGDRHFSEAMKMERKSLPPLYEFTVSPLNSRPYSEAEEKNPLRIPGSFCVKNNFAILEFSGAKEERAMKISYYDKDGALLFETGVKADAMK